MREWNEKVLGGKNKRGRAKVKKKEKEVEMGGDECARVRVTGVMVGGLCGWD